jgi:transcriptional regulator with XRE-family HTH domain
VWSEDVAMNTLAYYRKRAGLTQTELAAKTGIPQPNIARLESGDRSISNLTLETAVRIAKALEINAEDLLRKEPEMKHITINDGNALDYTATYYLRRLDHDMIYDALEIIRDDDLDNVSYEITYKADSDVYPGMTMEQVYNYEKVRVADMLAELGILERASNEYIDGYCTGANY